MDITVSVLLPVINETFSLEETVKMALQLSRMHIKEILILISDKTTIGSIKVIQSIKKKYPNLVRVHKQTLPFLGGALREGFQLARGNHTLMMASDLETDPTVIPRMIQLVEQHGFEIVATSRWRGKGGFKGYNPLKLVLNWFFQRIFSLLFQVRLTDMSFGYRLFNTALINSITWTELRHPFNLETILKPLKLGVLVAEIPCPWKPRIEGRSQNPFLRNFEYAKTGFRIWLTQKEAFVKKEVLEQYKGKTSKCVLIEA